MRATQSIVTLLFLAKAMSIAAQPVASPPCTAASGGGNTMQGCGHHGHPGSDARWGGSDTPGWSMMTPLERQAHHDRIEGFKSYEECKAYLAQHHQEMVARAKERGRTTPAQPRYDACAPLKHKKAK